MALTKVQIDGVEFSDSTDLNVDNGTLVVDSSTNRVGVGTTSPSTSLQVDGSWVSNYGTVNITGPDDGLMGVGLRNSSTYLGGVFFRDGTAGDFLELSAQGSRSIRAMTNGSEALRIDSSGRVGIGTSSPSEPLHVNSGTTNNIATFESTDAGAVINITDSVGSSSIETNDTQLKIGVDPSNSVSGSNLRLQVDGSTKLLINDSGRVGIGTTSPNRLLHVSGSGAQAVLVGSTDAGGALLILDGDANGDGSGSDYAYIRHNTSGDLDFTNLKSGVITFSGTSDSEKARIDSSGRLLVGTSSGTNRGRLTVAYDVDSNNSIQESASLVLQNRNRDLNGELAGGVFMDCYRDVSSPAYAGGIWFLRNQYSGNASSSTDIVFGTQSNGGTGLPTERMRINSTGFLKVSNTGSYISATGAYNEFRSSDGSNPVVYLTADDTNFSTDMLFLRAERASSSSFYFMVCRNSGLSNNAILLRGDGNAYADGSWNGGGADYAEYFEWSDGNTASEDRRGISVVLDSDKIRRAVAGEEPIGVISGNPSVVGDADANQWKHKHLRDEYGSFVLDENGERQLNPDYDSDIEYVSREDRPEWDCVGLMGKLRIRKGQVTGARWIKMRDISDNVEEWLVR